MHIPKSHPNYEDLLDLEQQLHDREQLLAREKSLFEAKCVREKLKARLNYAPAVFSSPLFHLIFF